MSFPVINHINDVLPAIADKPEFIVAERDGYKVINYTVAFEDSFSGPHEDILRECRGLVFDAEGNILARRLHKFFNLGERESTKFDALPWHEPHFIMDKLDGSMITPMYVNGEVRWGTKMGLTDVAGPVEEHINRFGGAQTRNNKYFQFARSCRDLDVTPIFEWCSNKQRIVVDHPEDQLILLHVRLNRLGLYMPRSEVNEIGRIWGIPTVHVWDSKTYTPLFLIEMIKELEGEEGVVVQFKNGDMVKIKSDWYVRLHRVKDKISTERRTLECILAGEIDDLLPILQPDDVTRVRALENAFHDAIKRSADQVLDVLSAEVGKTKKDFALGLAKTLPPHITTTVFKFFDERFDSESTIVAFLIELTKKNVSTEAKFEAFRTQLGF